ncbi:hypothetical protein C8R44DRAFT_978960 [Mycena epipterygia]|nr:hypothetical protein C8R44DRAFT_978960 [Mycena epipterygia]
MHRAPWVIPPNLPQAWKDRAYPTTYDEAARPRTPPVEIPQPTEAPPPIPDRLRHRECLYGFEVTDAHLVAYCRSNPDQILPPEEDEPLRLYHKHEAIRRVAKNLGMDVNIERTWGFEDIAWFSYTVRGVIKITQVPTSSRLALFATELEITNDVQWLDSQVNAFR